MESELKFVVPNHLVQGIIKFTEALCKPDGEHPVAIISSIYFDTNELDAVNEKLNSDFYKTKYRLRWYQNSRTGKFSENAYMEFKRRLGSKRIKRRAIIDISPADINNLKLQSPLFQDMVHHLHNKGVIPTNVLSPSLLIRYNRRRYVDPVSGSRIAIDSDIHVPRCNPNLLPSSGNGAIQNAVLEIKSENAEFPNSMLPLFSMGLRKSSFSKYLCCYAKTNNITFDPR